MDKEYYQFGYHCDNCGHNGVDSSEKGRERPGAVVCDNCGCNAGTNTYVPKENSIRM